MSTRLFRVPEGILAVERDGLLVYGPTKALRAVDVIIEDRPTEQWIALPEADWRSLDETTLKAVTGAGRVESLIRGRAAVFTVPSTQTEATVRASVAAFTPPKSVLEVATERLLIWKAGTSQPRRDELLDVLTVLGL